MDSIAHYQQFMFNSWGSKWRIRGVNVLEKPPSDSSYVQLCQRPNEQWCAEHWFRLNGIFVSEQHDEYDKQKPAVKDAAEIAKNRRIPFVEKPHIEAKERFVDACDVETVE